ncbi:MAG TPA: hypothetical protein VFR58_15410 [Flavisolibacter sp.]|nr:hypothetical protein [Flavisolibacter sp.]
MTKGLIFFRILLLCLIILILASCARSLTPEKAAGGGYKRSRSVL